MTTVHKNLTGADLHEPKGADVALNGQVYVSNGSGSGVWTTATSVITNTAFTTGDLKPTHKTSADTSWILWSDGTIGDGSSSATIRANADTAALFAVYWNGYSNTLCPVSTGRGVSAVADFAAHKTIALPLGAGRVFGLAGSGSGLTARTVGSTVGTETVTIAQANLPNITIGVTGTLTSTSTGSTFVLAAAGFSSAGYISGGGGPVQYLNTQSSTAVAVTSTGNAAASLATASINGAVTQTAMANVQPTSWVNMMIKL